jgi:nucleotide-binding universal stress UspA family protein
MNRDLSRILVGSDLTPGARRVQSRALRLPLARNAALELLHAVPRTAPGSFEAEVRRAALAALEREAGRLRRSATTVRVRTTLGSGEPAAALMGAARARRAELVTVGAHGPRGLPDLDLGSTAEHLIQHGGVPVLVVRRVPRGPYRHLLVAVDLGGSYRTALDLALRWMAPAGCRITMIHALEPPPESALRLAGTTADELERYQQRAEEEVGAMLETEARRLERLGYAVEPTIARGDPRSVLALAAKRLKADLVVLGSRRAMERTGLLLGSVARRLARQAPCDVLVARPAVGRRPRRN